ncbi:MAG: DUF885 domain-containing protein [Lachnospiraceae bacterium]|nr:DUF885 domain-containing protein [Lachnospiraceae bacterium]
MIKNKKIMAIFLAAVMTLGMAGCGKNKKDDGQKETSEVVTTESESDNSDISEISEEPSVDVTNTEVTTTEEDVDLNSPEAIAEQERFDDWLWDSFVDMVNADSITLNYSLANPEEYGVTPTDATYGEIDMSEESMEQDKQDTLDSIKEMEDFDYSLLTEEQKFTYDILYDVTETNLMSYDYMYLYEPFAYTSGVHSNMPIVLAEYNFYDKQDVEDYLTLLTLTPDYFSECLDFEKVKSEKGLFMSSHSANEVIRQCSEFIAKPEENLLIETFEDKIRQMDGLSESEIQEYIKTNHDNVINYIIPAYQSVIDTFKQLKNTGNNDLGLCYLEGGKEYYAYLLRSKTGTDKTPEEVIDLLDDAIDDTMSDLYSQLFSDYEAYNDYFTAIDEETLYEDFDYKETIEFFEDAVDDRFPEIPDIDFKVTPVHKSLENIVSPAFYMTPPLDDYEHNSIYINQGTSSSQSLWSTLAHEGVPGHMYQFVYFLSSDPEPIRTLLDFTGYQEGWATYVEMMSFDYYDKYDNPAYAAFESANNRLNLLVSARVEIGVNYEGWDLEDTKNYLSSNGFMADAAQDIIDYVVAEPGNYQMYCTGWLEFEGLKDYAEDELGDKFDEKEFHKVILDAGPCQFYLLRNKVEQYVQSVK